MSKVSHTCRVLCSLRPCILTKTTAAPGLTDRRVEVLKATLSTSGKLSHGPVSQGSRTGKYMPKRVAEESLIPTDPDSKEVTSQLSVTVGPQTTGPYINPKVTGTRL